MKKRLTSISAEYDVLLTASQLLVNLSTFKFIFMTTLGIEGVKILRLTTTLLSECRVLSSSSFKLGLSLNLLDFSPLLCISN